MTFTPDNSQGFFLDPNLIIPSDPTDMAYRAKDLYEQIADAVNVRDIAVYALAEVETAQQWFIPGNPQRYYDGWRKVIQMPDIPAGMSSGPIAHKINGVLKMTRYWAQGTSGTSYYQIPWVNIGAANVIEIDVTTTDVTIINGLATDLTDVFVVLEYIKGE